MKAAIDKLCQMPEIGSPRFLKNPELAGLRMWPVSGFDKVLIYYIPREDLLDIIRILHSARDREEELNR